jgi:precorrin-4/cobalt-precorrin-4 C11-methyltransferase
MTVYFIGSGPGDPELLTVKAGKIIKGADVIVYAGSLVNKDILKCARHDVRLYDSSKLTLEEIVEIIVTAAQEKKTVARLHSGDPSIYGAIQEQIELLEGRNISYEIVPGVSSFTAAAATLKKEYTIPDVTQTVIITRMEGKTKVPERESLGELARHRASMCIFLSVQAIDRVVEELKKGYPDTTPVAVVYRVSQSDEKAIIGSLDDIAAKVKREGIEKTALILVGEFLKSRGKKSRLYDKGFTHEFRTGR